MKPVVTIGRHEIGPGHPVYIVAELSGNHGGELARALEIVDAAAAAGADAVKVQTYTADSLTLDVDAPPFVVEGGTAWDTRTLHDVYADAAMPWEWQPVLAARARELGLDCFSSPFDDAAVTFLEELDVPAYKIASFELVDIPLIERVARTGKPVILSAGMADRSEIEAALAAVRRAGGEQVVVLKCTSSYPAPPESMNLRSIPAWTDAFGVPVGLSDHSLDIAVPVAAVALGACVVEKHLTLRRSDGGPDASFSLEPRELADTVAAVRTTERALGRVVWEADEADRAMRRYRRSLFAVADVAEGELLTVENVRSIRPADGLASARLADLLGRRARRAIARGTPMRDDLID